MIIRAPRPEDTTFIVDTWYKCWTSQLDAAERSFATKDVLFSAIAQLFFSGETYVAEDEDTGEIAGYICGEGGDLSLLLYFGYVRRRCRNAGVLRQLLLKLFGRTEDILAACRAAPGMEIAMTARHGWRWGPSISYLLALEGLKNASATNEERGQGRGPAAPQGAAQVSEVP